MFTLVLLASTIFFCARMGRKRTKAQKGFTIPRQMTSMPQIFQPVSWHEIQTQMYRRRRIDYMLAAALEDDNVNTNRIKLRFDAGQHFFYLREKQLLLTALCRIQLH